MNDEKIKIILLIMDKQLQYKIIHLTHQRDELIKRLQDLAEDLDYNDINDIIYDIIKINKKLKKLSNEKTDI